MLMLEIRSVIFNSWVENQFSLQHLKMEIQSRCGFLQKDLPSQDFLDKEQVMQINQLKSDFMEAKMIQSCMELETWFHVQPMEI